MEDGAGDGEAAKLLERFIKKVTGIKVWGDENVGTTGDRRIGGFFLADLGMDGGVELHFSVDEKALFTEKRNNLLRKSNELIASATAESREGEEGDARFVGEEGLGRRMGL